MERTIFKIGKIESNKILIHHHLGLGDTIICNGLINYLTNYKGFKCYLPVKNNNYEMINYLYKDNKKLKTFKISNENRDFAINNYSIENNLQILKVGFEKTKNHNFNTHFYHQLYLPYRYSYKYFYLPEDPIKSEELKKYHLEKYNVKNDKYVLIHSESSLKNYNLKITTEHIKIFVEKKTDIFNNIFLYKELILGAEEVHCINGSFLHLVDRVNSKSKLYYHNVRRNNLFLSRKWKWIEYEI